MTAKHSMHARLAGSRLDRLRPSLVVWFAVALVAVLAVFVLGALVARRSTQDAAGAIASAEAQYDRALESAHRLSDRVAAFHHGVLELPRPASAEDYAAAVRLAAELPRRLEQRPGAPADAAEEGASAASIEVFRDTGLSLVGLGRQRDEEITAGRAAITALAARSARAASGVTSGEQVLARRSLTELARLASAARDDMLQGFLAPSRPNEALVYGDIEGLGRYFAQHDAEFLQSPGRAWREIQLQDFVAAARAWGRFAELDAEVGARRAQFDALAGQLSAALEAEIRRTSATALASARTDAEISALAGERHLTLVAGWVLVLLAGIALAAGYGIVRPARRLLASTRRLGQGERGVSVPHGGIRELDELARAFNVMAGELQAGEKALRDHQATLEERVSARTAQLRHLAHHDPLTGLPNRRELENHLATRIARTRTSTASCAVFYLDIDNFKSMNDTLGHGFGDRVLRQIAERLSRAADGRAFLARLGGDEFTLVVTADRAGAAPEAFAEEVIRAFQEPVRVDAREVLVSVSIGIAVAPEHGETPEALLQAADAALFHAKDRGRRGFALFRPDLLAAAAHRFHTEQGLRRALEGGEFELYLQPQVSLPGWRPTTLEALLRWRKPDGTVLAASEFIPVAEESGLILEIGDWVLSEATAIAKRLRTAHWPGARIAVNVSPQQFLTGRCVPAIESALREHGMPADCLEIELTETAVQTGRVAVEALRRLRERGIAVALDDFGTGFSSLKSLDALPLSRVKLDKSLTGSVDGNARSAAIAMSVIGLCRELGLAVTAEGIERISQLEAISAFGPLDVQGFLVAGPMPSQEIGRFLSEGPRRLAQAWPRLALAPDDGGSGDAGVVTPFRPRGG